MKPLTTFGPRQPSCHSLPVAWSMAMPLLVLSSFFGAAPLMKYSLTVRWVNGPGSMPLLASTEIELTPLGLPSNLAMGSPRRASWRKACHRLAAVSRAIVPFGGALLSELPIQAPTARAGAFLSLGAATKPMAARSISSLVVPVLSAAGRRLPPSYRARRDQNGLLRGSVFDWRMSFMIQAPPTLMAWVPVAFLAGGQIGLASLSSTDRIAVRGISTPLSAIVP